MDLVELNKLIDLLHLEMDTSSEAVTTAALKAQGEVYDMLLDQINYFQLTDGRFEIGQPYVKRFAIIQNKMVDIIGKTYIPSVRSYLNTYTTVEQMNVAMQKSYNDLEVDTAKLTPARQTVYKQAEYALTEAISDTYIQPVKYLLMQQVNTGMTIKKSQQILANWTADKGSTANLTTGAHVPRLDKYANQIARDSIYKMNGAINQIIQQEYGLDHFVYSGNIIELTRPLCRHLVNLRRIISLDEMPQLIKKYPQGLYPDTSKKNFISVTGGFSCLHTATSVRKR